MTETAPRTTPGPGRSFEKEFRPLRTGEVFSAKPGDGSRKDEYHRNLDYAERTAADRETREKAEHETEKAAHELAFESILDPLSVLELKRTGKSANLRVLTINKQSHLNKIDQIREATQQVIKELKEKAKIRPSIEEGWDRNWREKAEAALPAQERAILEAALAKVGGLQKELKLVQAELDEAADNYIDQKDTEGLLANNDDLRDQVKQELEKLFGMSYTELRDLSKHQMDEKDEKKQNEEENKKTNEPDKNSDLRVDPPVITKEERIEKYRKSADAARNAKEPFYTEAQKSHQADREARKAKAENEAAEYKELLDLVLNPAGIDFLKKDLKQARIQHVNNLTKLESVQNEAVTSYVIMRLLPAYGSREEVINQVPQRIGEDLVAKVKEAVKEELTLTADEITEAERLRLEQEARKAAEEYEKDPARARARERDRHQPDRTATQSQANQGHDPTLVHYLNSQAHIDIDPILEEINAADREHDRHKRTKALATLAKKYGGETITLPDGSSVSAGFEAGDRLRKSKVRKSLNPRNLLLRNKEQHDAVMKYIAEQTDSYDAANAIMSGKKRNEAVFGRIKSAVSDKRDADAYAMLGEMKGRGSGKFRAKAHSHIAVENYNGANLDSTIAKIEKIEGLPLLRIIRKDKAYEDLAVKVAKKGNPRGAQKIIKERIKRTPAKSRAKKKISK